MLESGNAQHQASKVVSPRRQVTLGAPHVAIQAAPPREPVALMSKRSGRADFSSSMSHATLTGVELADGKTYSRIEFPGLMASGAAGMPELPVREELIRIPAGATVKLAVDRVSWHELAQGLVLPPVQPPYPDVKRVGSDERVDAVPFMKNIQAYGRNAFANPVPVVLGETVRIRGREYVKVIYQPVSYNPVRQQVRVAYDVQWHLEITGPEKFRRQRTDRFWKPVDGAIDVRTAEQVDAEEAPPADDSETSADGVFTADSASGVSFQGVTSKEDADYLIITPDRFAEAVAPLAVWKHKKGYKTYVATLSEVGSTQADIQQYIRAAYASGTPTTYVLLIGDHEELPAFQIIGHPYHGASHVWHVDHPYSLVEGGDDYPDLYIARLPGDTVEQIASMVNKALLYDKTPDVGDWYSEVLLAGQFQDTDDNNLIADRLFMEDLNRMADFLGGDYGFFGPWNGYGEADPFDKGYTVHTALQWDSPPTEPLRYGGWDYNGRLTPPTYVPDAWKAMGSGVAARISTTINNGVALVFHRDHGYSGLATGGEGWADPDYRQTHVEALENGARLPFVFSLNCASGWFDDADKFAESWMRNGNGGAVGYTGAARVSYSGYNDAFHVGIMDTFWDDYSDYDNQTSVPYGQSWRPAEAMVRAKAFVFASYGAASPNALLTARMFNWFGDPELQLRTETPQVLAVVHTSELTIGEPVDLAVTVSRGGTPCPGALVALVMDHGGVYETAISDADGVASFSVTPLGIGDITVTVTEQNSIPYEGIMSVASGSEPVIGVGTPFLKPSVTLGGTAADQAFDVMNIGTGTLNYAVSTDAAWLRCSPSSGSSTGEVDTITVHYDTADLVAGTYRATITVRDPDAANVEVAIPVTLTVELPSAVVFYHMAMDTAPGWTLAGGWAFGQPTGGLGTRGNPDPTAGYDGSHVLGYNLQGGYENSLPETRWATTTAIDCRDHLSVKLQFQRWLGVERAPYDRAYVEVSNDGQNWTNVWQNSTAVDDGAWVLCEYDISAVADDQPTVYIRWGMGRTDSSVTYCGWNLDEVQLTGSYVGPLTRIPVTVTLGGLSQIYDGMAKPVSVSTDPGGLAVAVTYNGSSVVPTNAGSYAVEATVVGDEYAGMAGGTLVIAPAVIELVAENKSKVSGEADPELTYHIRTVKPCSADTIDLSKVVDGDLARDDGESPGTYTIRQGSLMGEDANFAVTVIEGTLTIREASVLSDSNGNGLADSWQAAHAIDDPDGDADGDGVSNYAEFIAGTDPHDRTKCLQILSLRKNSDGYPEITWNSEQDGSTPLRLYRLQRCTNLAAGVWEDVESDIAPAGATTTREDAASGVLSASYYRVVPY
jgi:hypothetical protein